MRPHITLAEILFLLVPTVAVGLALIVGALNAHEPQWAPMVAQAVGMTVILAAICGAFSTRAGVRTFCLALVATSLVYLGFTQLGSGALAAESPTTWLLSTIWSSTGRVEPASAVWGSYPAMGTLPGPMVADGSGGFMYSGVIVQSSVLQTPGLDAFLRTGHWAIALLIGVICGLVARAVASKENPDRSAA